MTERNPGRITRIITRNLPNAINALRTEGMSRTIKAIHQINRTQLGTTMFYESDGVYIKLGDQRPKTAIDRSGFTIFQDEHEGMVGIKIRGIFAGAVKKNAQQINEPETYY